MTLDDLRQLREKAAKEMTLRTEHQKFRIKVSMGTSGLAKGAREVMGAMEDAIQAKGLANEVEVVITGSAGVEALEPFVTVEEKGEQPVYYGAVDVETAKRIVEEHIVGGTKVASHIVARQQLPTEVQ